MGEKYNENSQNSDGTDDESIFSADELQNNSVCWETEMEIDKTRNDKMIVQWENLEVTAIQQDKRLIKNISGHVKPFSILAIMGSSGAGKSTFMNVLAGRNLSNLRINGSILVNGSPIGDKMPSISAYIQQNDIFVGSLTVIEHLRFHAALQMPKSTKRTRRIRIEQLLEHFGLSKCRNTLIGFPGISKTISGGEMRRLNLATELITNPPIVFCDEPTSGLDSFLAEIVVTSLVDLAKNGTTIICTIHQPPSSTFSLFSHLMLMAEGDVAYIGKQLEAKKFFDFINKPVPNHFNPSDHYIEQVAIIPGKEAESCANMEKICQSFKCYKELNNSAEMFALSEVSCDPNTRRHKLCKFEKASFAVTFQWLLWRSIKQQYLDPSFAMIKLLQTLATAISIGLLFLRQPWNNIYTLDDTAMITGGLFLIITCYSTCFLFMLVVEFPLQIPVLRREVYSKHYTILASYLADLLAGLFLVFFAPLIFTPILYYMAGYTPGVIRIVRFYFNNMMTIFSCTGMAYFVSAISPDALTANIIAPAFLVPAFLCSGFFLPWNEVPKYFYPVQLLSWFYYGIENILINQWSGTDICVRIDASKFVNSLPEKCDEIIPEFNRTTVDLISGILVNQTETCFEESPLCPTENKYLVDASFIIGEYGYNEGNYTRNCVVLFALGVGWRIVAFFVLYFKFRATNQ